MSVLPVSFAGRAARPVRVGSELVQPGEARVVALPLTDKGRAPGPKLPVFTVVGTTGGPHLTVLAAPRGDELAATLAATRLCHRKTAAELRGSLTVVPVLRARGLADAADEASASPARRTSRWRFPGDISGSAREYAAFQIFSALAVPADLVVVFTSPLRHRASGLVARVNKVDPIARAWASAAAPDAILPGVPRPGSLAAALAELGGHVLTLSCFRGAEHLTADADRLLLAWDRLGEALGLWDEPAGAPRASARLKEATEPRVPSFERVRWVKAPAAGLLTTSVAPGMSVSARAPLAVLERLPRPEKKLPRRVTVHAPLGRTRVVVETATPRLVRKGERIILLAKGAPRAPSTAVVPTAGAGKKARDLSVVTDASDRRGVDGDATATTSPYAAGWVEWAALPDLGLPRVRAKLDTGARTAALHVLRFKRVGGTEARPLLSIELPPSSPRKKKRLHAEARVREWIDVRDTSGRTERRPVIETTLVLGELVRRIRITLTNRGDMRFPFLLGRTALGPHVVVHAHRRNLLSRPPGAISSK